MTTAEEAYLSIGQGLKGAIQSQLFGKPCFKAEGKAFVCFFKNAMVFKLSGDSHTEALCLDGTHLFDPSGKGRPMKEWVQVPFVYHDKWEKYAREALNYVNSK
ncbi:MAG: hypothetical protein K0S23_354 [Fluviicola sp.]|jgi:hypothetical protein|uniref:hypothetical protein n=1 Tax=Fluviicola sp. TaxID=1917219 RepID=UPI00261F620B|nr:hypothetical protein [Fluviicola sp.]MDF3026047.1 hypothetical protein [Fluviicola sp.]